MNEVGMDKQATYNEKLKTCFNHCLNEYGSVSAQEVHDEMMSRGWASPLDTVLDTHKLLVEIFGEP